MVLLFRIRIRENYLELLQKPIPMTGIKFCLNPNPSGERVPTDRLLVIHDREH
jgi:hypothetical protein